MIRALIFDLDETLIDRHETMRAFLIAQHARLTALTQCKADVFATTCLKFQANGYADKLEAFSSACSALGFTDAQLPHALFADFKKHYGTKAIAFEGAVEIIEAFSHDFTLGLITNGRTVGQTAKLHSAGLHSFFSSIIISEAQGVKKPDHSLFKTCLKELGLSASEAVFIGDNPSADITPASALGMHTIWMRNEYYDQPDNCDAVVDGVSELPEAVAMLCNT